MVLESLISLTCATFNGNAHDACTQALQAGTKQSSIEQSVGSIEDRISKQADREARTIVGDTGMNTGAVVGGAGKAIVDRALSIKIPVFAPQFFVKVDISVTKSLLGLEWKF